MEEVVKPRVFISHTAQDKGSARSLAQMLRAFKYEVWYDEWEIAVGDSIVEKVFDGLRASDTLILVLSPASVQSRWVREELNVAVMRRIAENDIRILPVMIATCEVPTSLKHLRYADFRDDPEEGLASLLDSLTPGYRLWRSLSYLYDHLCLLCDDLASKDLDASVENSIVTICDLLESALDVRTEIEIRRARERTKDLNFFAKLGFLADKGLDVRSQTWLSFLRYRSTLAHNMRGHEGILRHIAYSLSERHPDRDLRGALIGGLDRMKQIMGLICFDSRSSKESPNTAAQADT